MKLPIYVAQVDPCLFKQVKGLSKMAVINFTGAAGASSSSFPSIQHHDYSAQHECGKHKSKPLLSDMIQVGWLRHTEGTTFLLEGI